ncbi:TA system antitoxin ParD family protein [Allopusillimonas ginsengisoli]
MSRAVSGQIECWIRLNQAVESVAGFDIGRVRTA